MMIQETIERQCCEPQDLKTYGGTFSIDSPHTVLMFCKHCGQLWGYKGKWPREKEALERINA